MCWPMRLPEATVLYILELCSLQSLYRRQQLSAVEVRPFVLILEQYYPAAPLSTATCGSRGTSVKNSQDALTPFDGIPVVLLLDRLQHSQSLRLVRSRQVAGLRKAISRLPVMRLAV